MSSAAASLPYHEPGIVTILILASFVLVENVVNFVFDRVLFCGLIGQIAVGLAWGTPGANWLSLEAQNAIVQLGYLGLILIVYEGGLSTDLKALRSNLTLSCVVALLGISAPIGLSFILRGFMDITPLQAFAAGAALCSTSLGTTFTILGTSGLGQSRLGVVLSSAAMMDDIVGLVMSAVIGSLGTSSDFSAIAVIRPVFVSIAFAVVLPAICIWIVKPLAKLIYKSPITLKGFTLHRMLDAKGTAFAVHTLVLVGLVTGASYAGTSNLFAAYLAGACVTWWDGLCEQLSTGSIAKKSLQDGKKVSASKENVASSRSDRQREPHQQNQNLKSESPPSKEIPAQSHGNDQGGMSGLSRSDEHSRDSHGVQIFASYFSGPVERILKPFFFASIGFSIPIRRMFSGYVLWRGIVYFVLMTIGKLVCGMCLVRFKSVDMPSSAIKRLVPPRLSACWPWPKSSKVNESQHVNKKSSQPKTSNTAPAKSASNGQKRMQILKPKSLYPAALLGSAMVARGEIGFLISSVAETNGVFGSSAGDQNSDLFLVTTWAILLCTLCGPICVGMMVKSVRKLQAGERNQQSGREDPLGIWGIIPSTGDKAW